jgi:biotin transport system substrate-specific component
VSAHAAHAASAAPGALSDLARPRALPWALAYDVALITAGSLAVALSAQVAVPLPFTPVPVTAQPFAVLLVGALLGARRGALALVAYLAEGALGAPVFAGGAFGPATLAGPSGGYLVGFVPAAALCGGLAERGWDRRFLSTLLAMALGTCCLYACGLPWLARFVGADRVLALGFLPFIVGDGLKITLAALALPLGWRGLGWLGQGRHA